MLGTLNTLVALLVFANQPQIAVPEATPPVAEITRPTSAAGIESPVIIAQNTEIPIPDVPQPITPRLISDPAPDLSPPVILAQETLALADEAETEIIIDIPQAPVGDPTTVSPTERRAIIKAAGEALSAVGTAKGRFTQVAPDFSVTTGNFAIRRPGRVRFAYDAPVPILIVADGTTVAIEDSELETIDRVPLVATPLNLVLDDDINFETEAEIVNVQRANGVVAISMRDRSGETDGILTLVLDARSYELLSWRTIDEAGGITSVSLEDIETNTQLSPRLFRLDDPEDTEDDDRR